MRVMAIVKGKQNSDASVMSSEEIHAAMGTYNEDIGLREKRGS